VKAIEIGYTIIPIEGYLFKTGFPLKKYSETITEIKNKAAVENNTTIRTTAKLLINSLYGKLASKYFLQTTEILDDQNLEIALDMFKVHRVTNLDENASINSHDIKPLNKPRLKINKDLIQEHFKRASNSLNDKDLNIAVASAITSYGRLDLYNLIQEVCNRGGIICYTDTDRIFA